MWVLVLDCTPSPQAPSPCTAWNQAILFASSLLSCSPGLQCSALAVLESPGSLENHRASWVRSLVGGGGVGAGNEAGDWDLGSAPHMKHFFRITSGHLHLRRLST